MQHAAGHKNTARFNENQTVEFPITMWWEGGLAATDVQSSEQVLEKLLKQADSKAEPQRTGWFS